MIRRELRFEGLETRRVLNSAPVLLTQTRDAGWEATAGEVSSMHDSISSSVFSHWDAEVVADFTNDGIDDILGRRPNGRWGMQVNDGLDLYVMPWGDPPPGEAELIDTADMNNDGWLDLISWNRTTGDIWVSVNVPGEGFVPEVWTNFYAPADWQHLFVDDFDGDGLVDILGGESSGHWWLAKNVRGDFHNFHWGSFPQFGWQDVVSGDFTGDDRADVMARGADNTWWLWEGSANGLHSARYWGHWKMRDEWFNVTTGDFNGDDVEDLIGRSDDGRLWVGSATKRGMHTWTWATGWVHRADWSNVSIVDMNGDGFLDQLGKSQDGTWWYARNTGEAKFQNHFWQRNDSELLATSFRRPEAIDLRAAFGEAPLLTAAAAEVPDLDVTVDRAGQIVLAGLDLELTGLRLTSESGSLMPTADHSPFPFQVSLLSDAHEVVLGILGETVMLDGSVTLDVGWRVGGTDLAAMYTTTDDVFFDANVDPELSSSITPERASERISRANRSAYEASLNDRFGIVTSQSQVSDDAVTADEVVAAVASQESAEVVSDVWAVVEERSVGDQTHPVIVVRVQAPTDVSVLDIRSVDGLLEPVNGASIEPFVGRLANNAANVSLIPPLGSTVTIEDEFVTGVVYRGDGSDLFLAFGDLDFRTLEFNLRN